MPKKTSPAQALRNLFDTSNRPIYAVDADRCIVYCNPALEAWLELTSDRIIGRLVEYRSEPASDPATHAETAGPLSDLCPPPRAFTGETCSGTVSCLPRDGRLVHRRADFISLQFNEPLIEPHLINQPSHGKPVGRSTPPTPGAVLALLATGDLTTDELAAQVTEQPDDLHRTIRRFRRAQAGRYGLASILGTGSAMRKVRSQIIAAAVSGANALVQGWPGTGRGSIARAIHYHAVGDATVRLLTLDGLVLSDDSLRRALDAVAGPAPEPARRPTLLIENIERLSQAQQSQLADVIRRGAIAARVVATLNTQPHTQSTTALENDAAEPARQVEPALLHSLSTITIDVPRLVERLDDLPLLAQFFLEAANRGNSKQLGSIRSDALDLLALYNWPGELAELRTAIAAAHAAATSHAITSADLPVVVLHAAKAAALPHRTQERVNLNELLATIEREAIVRALAQAGGNKSEAAELLGLTRPRLYRRMEQLGLISPQPSEPLPKFKEAPLPDFREIEPEEPVA